MWLVAVVGRCVVGCEHCEGFCSISFTSERYKSSFATTKFILLPKYQFFRFNVGLQAFTVLSILNVTKDSQIVSKVEATGVTNRVSDNGIENSKEKRPYDAALRNTRLHGIRKGTKGARRPAGS